MTPFALQLRATRAAYGLAQGEFAARIGYRQSYISAIESGSKIPKDAKLIERTIEVLDLDGAGESALREAFRLSQPHVFPPPGTPVFAYQACAKLAGLLPALTQAHATLLVQLAELIEREQYLTKTQKHIPRNSPTEEIAMHK